MHPRMVEDVPSLREVTVAVVVLAPVGVLHLVGDGVVLKKPLVLVGLQEQEVHVVLRQIHCFDLVCPFQFFHVANDLLRSQFLEVLHLFQLFTISDNGGQPRAGSVRRQKLFYGLHSQRLLWFFLGRVEYKVGWL